MSRTHKIQVLAFFAIGIIFVFGNYVIVIGQTTKPVLVALNKADSTLAIIDPVTMKVTGKVITGDSPHEVVLSADGKTAFVANYGAQTPGSSISVIDTASLKEIRRFDVAPLMRPHGLLVIGGKLYFTAEVNRIIARYDPVANKIDWLMGTGQNGSHMVVGTGDQKRFYTANIFSDSVTAFEFANVPPAGSKVTHISIGKQPEAIDLSPDGKEIWAGLNAGRRDRCRRYCDKQVQRKSKYRRTSVSSSIHAGRKVCRELDGRDKRAARDRCRNQEGSEADQA
jgi:YVTN family beta-propeller protein